MSDPFGGLFTGTAAPSSSGDPFAGVFAQSNAHAKAVAIGQQAEQKQLKIHLANQRVQQATQAQKKAHSFTSIFSPKNVIESAGNAVKKVIAKPAVSAAKAVARPVGDVATGQGGKLVHDTSQLARDTGTPATYFLNADIINPTKELAAEASGNKVAAKNANIKSNENLGLGDKGDRLGHGLLKLGVNSAFAGLGASSPGLAVSGAKKVVEKASVKDAKDLINRTRVTQALESKAPETKANLGKTVVKGANTTHVPVVEPTETVGARTKVGSTAINNADRTSIPVKSYSSEAKGKVTTMDGDAYAKKAQQLSKDYDKESAQLKTVSNPQAQRVLQERIDTKYSTAREALDNQAGKTSVSFTGKPTAQTLISGKPSEAPVSAAEPKPVQVTTPGKKVAPGVSTKPITVTKSTVEAGQLAPSGSALKSEARAVADAGAKEFPEKAQYRTGSYKTEAQNAVKLAHEDPTEAMHIAMARKPGNNTIHEVMVRRAVEQKALKEGDVDTLRQLAQSPHHTELSESAQKLGASGFEADANNPVRHIRVVSDERVKAFEKRTGKKLSTETKSVIKAAKSEVKAPTKDEWTGFISSLKC